MDDSGHLINRHGQPFDLHHRRQPDTRLESDFTLGNGRTTILRDSQIGRDHARIRLERRLNDGGVERQEFQLKTLDHVEALNDAQQWRQAGQAFRGMLFGPGALLMHSLTVTNPEGRVVKAEASIINPKNDQTLLDMR